MKKLDAEVLVGFVMLIGIGVLAYTSLRLGQLDLLKSSGYTVYANFTTAGGLQTGAAVELAGVRIGQVDHVGLADYQARVAMTLQREVILRNDARAAIKTNGLIGERYIELTPGVATGRIPSGGQIQHTESPVDIQQIIGEFLFGRVGEGNSRLENGQNEKEADPFALGLD